MSQEGEHRTPYKLKEWQLWVLKGVLLAAFLYVGSFITLSLAELLEPSNARLLKVSWMWGLIGGLIAYRWGALPLLKKWVR